MTWTAATLLAAFQSLAPAEYAKDPPRFATIAVAGESVVAEYGQRFVKGPRMLGAAVATAIRKESAFWLDVHDGSRVGPSGEVCLVQIHPSNPHWQRVGAPLREALAGTDYESTRWCLATGAVSLSSALSHCWAQRFWKNWAQAMWTQYHYGNRCWLSPHAYKRTAMMRRIAYTRWEPTQEHRRLVAEARERIR